MDELDKQKPRRFEVQKDGSVKNGESQIPPSFIPSSVPTRLPKVVEQEYSHQTGKLKISNNNRRIIKTGLNPNNLEDIPNDLDFKSRSFSSEYDPNVKIKKKFRLPSSVKRGIFAIISFSLILTVSFGIYVYKTAEELDSKINRISVLSDSKDDSRDAEVYLLVGNDARSQDAQTDVLGSRADTIILGIHPSKNSGKPDALVSIPRDIFVDIPSFVDSKQIFGKKDVLITDAKAKVNAAYTYGGPELLIRTVEKLTNLKIDHYAEVGFDSLAGLIDNIGGIWLCYDKSVNDSDSGLIWNAGCRDVDGWLGLAFARMRHADPSEDINRMERQRQVVQAISEKTDKIVREGNLFNLFNIPKLKSLSVTSLPFVTLDSSMNIWQIKDMASCLHHATDSGGIITNIPVEGQTWNKTLGAGLKTDSAKIKEFFDSIT